MAISTKAELHTAVSNWLNRSDLTARIPEFISLVEASFNRSLRTRQMIVRSTASASSQYVGLPTDFLEMQNIELTSTSPPKRLIYISSDRSDDYRERRNNELGTPEYWTVEGESIQLLPTPILAVTLQMNYYKKIPAMSGLADSANNWLLISHPDIYLYGTLMQASPYLMDPQATEQWARLLAGGLQELHLSDEKSRFAGGTLSMRPKQVYS